MKKLLGVSIAAMLAVSPMMARAEGEPTQQADEISSVSDSAVNSIATTSYVAGAYNAIATEHNKVVADLTVPALQEGNYEAIKAGDSVKDNLVALDTAIANLDSEAGSTYQTITDSTVSSGMAANDANGNHITSGNLVGANLESLNTAVKANDASIALLNNADDTVSGSVKNSIKTLAKNANFDGTGTANLTNATSIDGAIKTLDTDMGATANLKKNTSGTDFVDGNVLYNHNGTLVQAVQKIAAAVDTANSGNSTKNTVQNNGNYITAGDGVASNLVALDTAAKANSTAINQILATNIPVYTTWNNSTPTNVSISNLQGGTAAGAPNVH